MNVFSHTTTAMLMLPVLTLKVALHVYVMKDSMAMDKFALVCTVLTINYNY